MINPQLLIFQAFYISSLQWMESWMINPLLTLTSAMGLSWLLSWLVFAIGFLCFLYIELHAWVIFSFSRSACHLAIYSFLRLACYSHSFHIDVCFRPDLSGMKARQPKENRFILEFRQRSAFHGRQHACLLPWYKLFAFTRSLTFITRCPLAVLRPDPSPQGYPRIYQPFERVTSSVAV